MLTKTHNLFHTTKFSQISKVLLMFALSVMILFIAEISSSGKFT
jgi:hypothetical protein